MTHLPDASYSSGGMHLSEPLVDTADAEAMAAELQMMSKPYGGRRLSHARPRTTPSRRPREGLATS